MLTYLPASTLAPLQRVLNASICNWLVQDLGQVHDMYELHWLPVTEKNQFIKFKLCLFGIHPAVNGRAPTYLTELTTPVPVANRSRLSPLSRKACSGCSAFKNGLTFTEIAQCFTCEIPKTPVFFTCETPSLNNIFIQCSFFREWHCH